ncbi:protein AMBP-like protein [Lates japonicus]|uniref:Protein AMBP-like protein n=1 Tax=Lates japonicus TaxID=270547 RepID=A0AAD3MK23_LATJO|nr:protein AMBP-like protein [Lates japonicus]
MDPSHLVLGHHVTSAVCRLPMAPQPCTGQPPIWAFDATVGLCVPYKQGFCQANANKFYTKAECEEYCRVVKDDAELLKAN